jgi:hypothetical protein
MVLHHVKHWLFSGEPRVHMGHKKRRAKIGRWKIGSTTCPAELKRTATPEKQSNATRREWEIHPTGWNWSSSSQERKVKIYLFQLDRFGAIVSHVSPSNWQHRDKWFSSEYRKSAGNVNFRYKVKLWYIWHSGNLYGNCRSAAMQYPWGSIDKALTQSADDWRIVFERRFVEKSNIMHRSSPENLLFLPFTTLVHCEDVRDTSQNCWSPKWHSWRLSCRVQTVTPQHSTGCVCKIGNPILANHRYPHYNGYLEDLDTSNTNFSDTPKWRFPEIGAPLLNHPF